MFKKSLLYFFEDSKQTEFHLHFTLQKSGYFRSLHEVLKKRGKKEENYQLKQKKEHSFWIYLSNKLRKHDMSFLKNENSSVGAQVRHEQKAKAWLVDCYCWRRVPSSQEFQGIRCKTHIWNVILMSSKSIAARMLSGIPDLDTAFIITWGNNCLTQVYQSVDCSTAPQTFKAWNEHIINRTKKGHTKRTRKALPPVSIFKTIGQLLIQSPHLGQNWLVKRTCHNC